LRIGNPGSADEGALIRADGPLRHKTVQLGWLSIGAQRTGAHSPLLALLLAALALGVLCLLVTQGARLLMERRLARSVNALTGATRALAAGTPRGAATLSPDDALAPLDAALVAAGQVLEREHDRLAAQLARLERLALSHDEAEWEWQLDTGDIWYSDRFPSLLGYDADDGFGRQFNWTAATHPDDATTVRRARERLVAREIERSDDQIRVRARDGTYRWFRLRAVASHDTTGKAVCLSGTLEDVTRERMTLDSLRESEARLFHAVRGSFDGAWDWDIGAGRYFLSPRLSELLGMQQSLQPQTHEQLLERVHPDDLSRLEHAIDEHFLRREAFDIEYRMRHEAGHYLWVRDRGLATRS
ncbi:MAG: PAS domain-containing protein, partial [Methyloversatilis sp.]|nr:PAS domain-containing protein [Methyloversatilis sp.]